MTRIKPLFITFLATTALVSCGPQTRVIRGDEYSGEDFIDIEINDKAAPIVNPVTLHPASARPRNPQTFQPKAVEKSVLDGEWIIIEAGGYKITRDEDMPYLYFSDRDHRFYASNGCNVLNGVFTFANGGKITFANVISTMKLCADVTYETAISDVLKDGVTVNSKIEKINNESYLTLSDARGQQLMRLRRHNLEVLNGQWAVSEIDGEEVSGDVVNVFFDVNEKLIHGNTGCNSFNGVIVIDPFVPSSINFAQMGVTQRACPNQEIERQMLVALEETYSYVLIGDDLYLRDSEGHTRMKLQRAK